MTSRSPSFPRIRVEELPQDVIISPITNSSMHHVGLSWTRNLDTDFRRYEIYRATSTTVGDVLGNWSPARARPGTCGASLVEERAEERLLYAAPNPFNPSTRLRVEAREPGQVEMKVWSMTGQLVFGLTFEASAGLNEVVWDGTDRTGAGVGSGVYLCRVRRAASTAEVRLLVVR